MEQLSQLVERLARNHVECVLVGGYAVTAYAGALMTRDVDVACRMTPDNLLRVYTALTDLHPRHRMSPQKPPFTREDALRPDWKNLYLATDIGPLDCLGAIAGLGDFEICLANSQPLDLGDFSLRILTLDALIIAKKALNRPRDHHAVLELEIVRERVRQQPPP